MGAASIVTPRSAARRTRMPASRSATRAPKARRMQDIQHRAVALRAAEIHPAHAHAVRRERAHHEEEGRVRPIPLHREHGRQAAALLSFYYVNHIMFTYRDPGQALRFLRHRDIGRGFERARDREAALARKPRQSQQQTGDILRGDIPWQGIVPRRELSAAAQQRAVRCDRHAVGGKLRIQRRERTLRQSAFTPEDRLRTQRADHRQQEAQRRTALPAGQEALPLRHRADGPHPQALSLRAYRGAESVQAGDRRRDIPGDTVAEEFCLPRTQRGTDQQAVGLGLGGRDLHAAAARPRRDKARHRTPPARSQSGISSSGTRRTSQRPIARGTTRCIEAPLRFLSVQTAAESSGSGKPVSVGRP